MKGSLKDTINAVLGSGLSDFNGDRNIDTGGETIVIEIDELLAGYNLPFVQLDIVNKERGFGDISFCYSRVVHPIACELFNGSITDDVTTTEDQLKEITNWRFNDDVADHILKSAQQKVWEVMNTSKRLVQVNSEDIVKFCITMLDNILSRLIDCARDYAARIGGNAFIQLDHRTSCELAPTYNPNVLKVKVYYGWMYM